MKSHLNLMEVNIEFGSFGQHVWPEHKEGIQSSSRIIANHCAPSPWLDFLQLFSDPLVFLCDNCCTLSVSLMGDLFLLCFACV